MRETGHISGLLSLLNAKSGEVQRARPRCLLKGQSAVVEVTPARPVCVEDYSDYRVSGEAAEGLLFIVFCRFKSCSLGAMACNACSVCRAARQDHRSWTRAACTGAPLLRPQQQPSRCPAPLQALGRVALRDGGRTVAVGIITRLPGLE